MFCIYTYILTHGLNCNLFHEQLQTKLKQNSDKDLNLNTERAGKQIVSPVAVPAFSLSHCQ